MSSVAQPKEPVRSRNDGTNSKKPCPGYASVVVVFVLGAVFFVGGLIPLVGQNVLATHSQTTTGTVIGSESYFPGGKTGCGGPAYYPTVSFTTVGSKQVTAKLTNVRICEKPSKGSTVQVLYDTTNPTNAEFPSASRNWEWPIVALVLGALLLTGASAMLVYIRRVRTAVANGAPIPGSKNQRKKRERAQARRDDLDPRARDFAQSLVDEHRDSPAEGRQ